MNTINVEQKIKKEDALDILDRTIGFVNNCDNKSAITLGILGIIATVIFTTDGISNIIGIINNTMINLTFGAALYLMLWLSSLVTLAYGIYRLISVLYAKINTSDMKQVGLDLDSKIFFGTIAKNETYKTYRDKLLYVDRDAFLNDIISQIYINSVICHRKFERHNKGFQITIIGFLCFMIMWIIGKYIF